MTNKQLINRLKAYQRRLAKERDGMRDLIYDYEQLSDNCDEAIDDIERAIDALSRTI